MSELKKGDKVQLKTKQPPVMVIEAIKSGKATCTWFDRQQELKQKSFDLAILEKFVPASSFPSLNSVLSR